MTTIEPTNDPAYIRSTHPKLSFNPAEGPAFKVAETILATPTNWPGMFAYYLSFQPLFDAAEVALALDLDLDQVLEHAWRKTTRRFKSNERPRTLLCPHSVIQLIELKEAIQNNGDVNLDLDLDQIAREAQRELRAEVQPREERKMEEPIDIAWQYVINQSYQLTSAQIAHEAGVSRPSVTRLRRARRQLVEQGVELPADWLTAKELLKEHGIKLDRRKG